MRGVCVCECARVCVREDKRGRGWLDECLVAGCDVRSETFIYEAQ